MNPTVPGLPVYHDNRHVTKRNQHNPPICCWSKGESLSETFCLESSLHGLKYIGQADRNVYEKAFWFISFLVSCASCVFVIMTLWNKYWEQPVVTVFQPVETPIDRIPFPAITICNVNNVRKSRVANYIKRAKDQIQSQDELYSAYADLYNLNHICTSSMTFAERFNLSAHNTIEPDLMKTVFDLHDRLPDPDPTVVLRKATQNCSEMILKCLWLDEVQNCDKIFHGVETDYGFCCTFNVVPLSLLLQLRNKSSHTREEIRDWKESTQHTNWNLLSPAKYPYRQVYTGKSSGLSVLLDPDLDEYFCKNTDSDGFVIGAGHPFDFPRVRDHGIAVRPNSETFMSIEPDLTIASPNIYSFGIDKRQCYFVGEKRLKYYAYYSAFNCVDECIANHTYDVCNCVQYYMPRSSDQLLCQPEQYECTETVRKDIIQKGLHYGCDSCHPSCDDVAYQVETTFLDMHKNVFQSNHGNNSSFNGRNLTIVHLYMGVDSTYPRLRKELYSIVDLISSTGGLLSLCLGFSLLSVLEICYFSTVRVCINLYRNYYADNGDEFQTRVDGISSNWQNGLNGENAWKDHLKSNIVNVQRNNVLLVQPRLATPGDQNGIHVPSKYDKLKIQW